MFILRPARMAALLNEGSRIQPAIHIPWNTFTLYCKGNIVPVLI